MKKLLIMIMFITVFIVGMARSKAPKDYSIYATNTLISPETANKMIESETDLVILDVRKKENFEKEHVRESFQIWKTDFSADKGEYKYDDMRATPSKIARILGSYGITPKTHILLLGEGGDYEVARLWWILDMYGHENISIIDGGIVGWKLAKLKVVGGAIAKPKIPAIYKFRSSVDLSRSANLEDVKVAMSNDTVILDTRSFFESDGLISGEKTFIKGRISGSDNIPWDIVVEEDKTFSSSKEIKEVLNKHGITKDMSVILYSESGMQSAHMTFVLRELLGYKDVKNYDGSWIQ
ncbi:MAG: rhodanese-like domain-containing protein, partial [Psychrilyobacter sp.]|uniref:sulfurtransferase n=1 Tax=Psychrilyobacter sp. TaxID=2586924 RepID=UPI003C746750